jgi:hypothetical protein
LKRASSTAFPLLRMRFIPRRHRRGVIGALIRMSVPDGRMRDIYGQSVNMVFYLGESGAGPIQPLRPAISAPPVILQSTHEAALDVVDLADLKHRALELS